MKDAVIPHVAACDVCCRTKTPRARPAGLLQQMPVADRPWATVTMHFIAKLPISDGYDSIWDLSEVCNLFGIKRKLPTAFHPQTD
jgi:hypothetical protein